MAKPESKGPGFIKLMRSDEMASLMDNYPKELYLMILIARRASFKRNPIIGLDVGEALVGVGDFLRHKWTERAYRTAVERLKKWRYIDTRTTNKGTIAKIVNTDICDLSKLGDDKQVTSKRQPSGGEGAAGRRLTKNKELKAENADSRIEKNRTENKRKDDCYNVAESKTSLSHELHSPASPGRSFHAAPDGAAGPSAPILSTEKNINKGIQPEKDRKDIVGKKDESRAPGNEEVKNRAKEEKSFREFLAVVGPNSELLKIISERGAPGDGKAAKAA